MYITLDIETIPSRLPEVRDYIAKTVTHPAVMKKAETIAKWEAEEKPQAIEEALSKTGLDGAFGEVIVVGLAIEDGEPFSISSSGESFLLSDLNEALNQIPRNEWFQTCVVGHNVSAFDLRFLMQRYIVNFVRPHPIISRAAQAKPWELDKVYDTMTQFAGIGNRISLDKLCMALGMPGKGEVTGADVWPMYQAGKLAEIAAYCEDDVRKIRNVFKRMTFR